jgi:hypothetical protein
MTQRRGAISHGVFVCGESPEYGSLVAMVLAEEEREVSAMLILDTELESTGEFPTVSQLLQSWAARLWAWLRRQPQPEIKRDEIRRDFIAGKESKNGQDCGTGLIL